MKKHVAQLVSLLVTIPVYATVSKQPQPVETHHFLQFNLMQSINARIPFNNQNTTYAEMEFGGRTQWMDLYGYVDVFDLFDRKSDDRHNSDNMFMKLQPRFSLDQITSRDLSVGPVKEWFISTLFEVGDASVKGKGVFNEYIGIGANAEVPWFGMMGFNLYKRYVRENYTAANESSWDGYKFASNWFKPFMNLSDGSFIAYQGYLDYGFGFRKYDKTRANHFVEWFNGFYWHSKSYAVGYGIKYFNNMTGMKDGVIIGVKKQDTSGIGHYLSVTYVFA